ncbi:hypothetical protein [Microbacterium nymphoidis]|uniref:hypothetical protein n=1 Tax=Microbacterium nymphoidis TaxID=2898586 RepID=UPI001E4FA1F8|nr:hypothetical protein [Microbacterium nymphoidis]MCD2496993.1 hypothetical protein [Microbacterium nymphoidis]
MTREGLRPASWHVTAKRPRMIAWRSSTSVSSHTRSSAAASAFSVSIDPSVMGLDLLADGAQGGEHARSGAVAFGGLLFGA